MKNDVSVIIPNWNGKHLLEKYLPSVFESIYEASVSSEVIVIDDGSTDDSIKFLQENYPNIHLIRNNTNRGFAITCNKGIECAKYRWVLLLNNDVSLTKDYIKILLSNGDVDNLFSVSGKILEMGTEKIIDGGKLGEFRGGNYRVTRNYMVEDLNSTRQTYYTFYNPATCCLYDRDKLLALNGFDEMFSPFYWEDTDIAYRAWKRGWISIFEPHANAYHVPGTTIGLVIRKKQIYIVSRRNKFFFHWKNLTDISLIFQHTVSLLLVAVFRWLLLDFKFYVALFSALRKYPEVRKKRKVEIKYRKLTDTDVMKYIDTGISGLKTSFF